MKGQIQFLGCIDNQYCSKTWCSIAYTVYAGELQKNNDMVTEYINACYQPPSQGSLLTIPTERERKVGERTWEQGWHGTCF